MEAVVLWVAALLLIGGLLLYFHGTAAAGREGRQAHHRELARMPGEIASGRLEMSEQRIRVRINEAEIYGRTEQVYRSPAGQLVPVENKTRRYSKVFPSDIIQVSLQSLALAEAGHAVGRHAYIRTRDNRTQQVQYHQVEVMPKSILERLVNRYFEIIEGRQEPTRQRNPNACSQCQFRSRCWSNED